MIFALGATTSIWDALQSLGAQSGTTSQITASSFEPIRDIAAPESTATACSSGNCSSPLSPQTLGALIAAQSPSAAKPSISPPSAPQNTIQQWTASLVSYGDGQIGHLPDFFKGAPGHFNLAGVTENPATATAPAPPTQATSVAWPSNLASLSYNQIAQLRPIETQSPSNLAPFAINS